jgi:hypothetical protein
MSFHDAAEYRAFARWLKKMGAERKNPAQWEIMRFTTSRGLLIIWTGKKGVKFNPVASELFERYCAGSTDRVAPLKPGQRGDATLLERAPLLAWVRANERVTVADLVAAAGGYLRGAYLRLAELERAGDLASEGGGPGEPIFWRPA